MRAHSQALANREGLDALKLGAEQTESQISHKKRVRFGALGPAAGTSSPRRIRLHNPGGLTEKNSQRGSIL